MRIETEVAPSLPADLLQAVSSAGGHITLVVGAGCSLELPTGLQLAATYSLDIHRRLVEDGLLEDGDCSSPEDLSVLASTVWEKHGSQTPVVSRLPLNQLRLAQPNPGYLLAAALLRERVVGAVLTLNFDLAISTALGQLSAIEIGIVPGPSAVDQVGSAVVIYLHRNVDESDDNKWILRLEALRDEWRDGWEEVVAQRVMSAPKVVFAGLGSPAAVLTETVGRIRSAVPEAHAAYVVDPSSDTPFKEVLHLPDEAHIRMGWCSFMELLAKRFVVELRHRFGEECRALCAANGWNSEEEFISDLCERLHDVGLVSLGRLRAAWLMESDLYVPDDARRRQLADLLLGVGLVERHYGATAEFVEDGTVRMHREGKPLGSFIAVSGQGTLRWHALEARVLERISTLRGIGRARSALMSGMSGGRPAVIAAPEDVVGEWGDDIVQGEPRPELIMVDEVRDEPTRAGLLTP